MFFCILMNHTLLLASLERLHDRITTLEKGVDGVHLGVRSVNPPNGHRIPMHHNPTHMSHAGMGGYGEHNPPTHTRSHAVVVNTVAEEIVHIAESWVRGVHTSHRPTDVDKTALVQYIKRHNSGIPKSELSTAVTWHLHNSVLTRNPHVGHLVSVVHDTIDQAYALPHQHH